MRSILLVKTSSLGDVVHNLPVASDIRARFPQARIDWVVEESFADIPRLHPAVGQGDPGGGAALAPRAAVASHLARTRRLSAWRQCGLNSTTWCSTPRGCSRAPCSPARRSGHATPATPPRRRASRWQRASTTPLTSFPKNLHAVERNRWLAAAALGYEPNLPLDYGIAAFVPLAAPWLPAGPYCVLLTASSRADKLWPEADWLQARRALNARGLACVLPGGSPGGADARRGWPAAWRRPSPRRRWASPSCRNCWPGRTRSWSASTPASATSPPPWGD
jgi:heptosyltransferase-1